MNNTMETISAFIFDPTNSLFKQKASEKARCDIIRCSQKDCPLRTNKQCILKTVIGQANCPYGKFTVEYGFTRKARKYYDWIKERKEKYANIPCLKFPTKKLAFIGDYVYLPYAHITMCKEIPFLTHANIMSSGTPLIKKEHWNIQTVLTLLNFKPQAFFGDTITTYQTEEIPLFISHLREEDKDMWKQLIKEKPELNTKQDFIGRRALLKTVNYPITWTPDTNPKYPVEWTWDGEFLTTNSKHVYNSSWGHVDLESFELKAKPQDNATIEIQDNSWVNKNTKFVD